VAVCEVASCATAVATDATTIMNGMIFLNMDYFLEVRNIGKIARKVTVELDGLTADLVTKCHVWAAPIITCEAHHSEFTGVLSRAIIKSVPEFTCRCR